MFETTIPQASESLGSPWGEAGVRAWQGALTAALESTSGLDDAAQVEAIRALEELVCTATAAQAALSAELDVSTRGSRARQGVRPERQGVGIGAQVGLARRESPHRGAKHLGLAKIVAVELPHTWAAWRSGRIGEWRATLIARETACLSLEHRLEVDRLVAADALALEAMGDRQVAGECAMHAARLDPASVTARRRKAESERRVTLRPAPDTMTRLDALLTIKQGVAVHAVLSRSADSARAAGDERSRGQVMADFLVAAVLAAGARARDDQTTWHREDAAARSDDTSPGIGVVVNLVISDHALFGTSEDPAHMEGLGPIPAELAREIITGACTRGEQTWLRRLYADPHSGQLVAMDARTRTFRGSLARFIRLRDQTCRTPWCNAPIRHVDHAKPAEDGGVTRAINSQGLCEACNYAKEGPGWRARPGPGGSVTTTTPTGHAYSTQPPAIATIRRTDLPPLRIDYILAG